jgi:hypothetical protein
MPALVAGIHVFPVLWRKRHKPGPPAGHAMLLRILIIAS